jgi:hypothetical protein
MEFLLIKPNFAISLIPALYRLIVDRTVSELSIRSHYFTCLVDLE